MSLILTRRMTAVSGVVRDLRLIVDDKEARNVAAVAGVEYVGTAGALLEAHLRHCVTSAS